MELKDKHRFYVESFGCKVNTYDSGLVQKNLTHAGFQGGDREDSEIFVINSCAVTAEASREAARQARRHKAKYPNSKVILTGCAAQVDTEMFSSLSGVDLVVANSHKGQLPQLVDDLLRGKDIAKVHKSNIFDKSDLEAGGGYEKSHTRAFLKIQDGCNSFCTYCVIPFARGKSRSLSPGDLIERVNDLHAEGLNEVVLTGVHIGDYTFTEGPRQFDLSDLVEELLRFTSIPQVKLSSLEPVELTPKLLKLYSDHPRLCSHFHMSIQSVSTKVLKGMKRNYDRTEVERSLRDIQSVRPGAFVGMDIIAGFPTETEEDFAETYEALDQLPWTWIHAFPYSERGGTFAARMKDTVPVPERKLRAKRLRELSQQRYLDQAQKQCGSIKQVMYLQNPSKGANCLSSDYWPVNVDSSIVQELKPGAIFKALVTDVYHSEGQTGLSAHAVGN